uniref:Uncharacterized protein n=1 Tax=Anguilla anguilla TaxID=7936 RepID=A0A0E9RB30_ANGAN
MSPVLCQQGSLICETETRRCSACVIFLSSVCHMTLLHGRALHTSYSGQGRGPRTSAKNSKRRP